LRFVLLIAKTLGQLASDLVGDLAERRDALSLLPGFDRVGAVTSEPAACKRPFSGLGKADLGIAAKPHFATECDL